MLNIFELAVIGGLVSFASTALGSFGYTLFQKSGPAEQLRNSIDFALGIMLSAAAFSLIGPEILGAWSDDHKLTLVLGALATGMIFISLTQKVATVFRGSAKSANNSARWLLATTLLIHNFPEGMGAGASLAGMPSLQAIPIQLAIIVQNLAEGFLMVLCLKSMGLSTIKSIVGGLVSGLVECFGALLAGSALTFSLNLLPLFLAAAGGAMVMSVLIEIKEALSEGRTLSVQQMFLGLITIPILNLTLGA